MRSWWIYLADAFPASLYLAWKYADDFERGVISNTNLGGDNCHRGALAGALLGVSVVSRVSLTVSSTGCKCN
jgi:ADP-ribosylglycohydrolase